MEKPTKYWLEAGTVLFFEKQPDKPFIPRRGESFTSQAVYMAVDVDVILAERGTLQTELDRYQTAIRQGLWGDTAPDEPHGKEIFVIRCEVVKLHEELARVREAVEKLECPACNNVGWYEVPNRNTGEPEQEQCRFCYERILALQPSRGDENG